METLNIFKAEYPFYNYICGVTGLTCCGCSLFCEHREEKKNNNETKMPKINFTDMPYKKEYSTGEHVRRADNPILTFDKTLNTNRYCDKCPNNPSNGGSGICHCILGQPHIT